MRYEVNPVDRAYQCQRPEEYHNLSTEAQHRYDHLALRRACRELVRDLKLEVSPEFERLIH